MSAVGNGPVRVAVVGLGWWGTRIIGGLADSASVTTVVGVDPDPERLRSLPAGIRGLPTLDAALADDEVEAVVLCTPHAAHAAQVAAAAATGRHVFCEKPFATTGAEARDALSAVATAGVVVGVGHERRFEPPVHELLSMLAAGDLGTPLHVEGTFSQDKFLALSPDNWRLSATHAPVGPLSATGVHLVDLATAVLGRPDSVWARLATLATSFENGDTLAITLGFPDGATAQLSAVLATPFVGRFSVLGSLGSAEIRDLAHPESPAGWDLVVRRRGEADVVRRVAPTDAVRDNLEAFAAAVRGSSQYPVTPAAVQTVVDTFEAVVASAASGRVERV